MQRAENKPLIRTGYEDIDKDQESQEVPTGDGSSRAFLSFTNKRKCRHLCLDRGRLPNYPSNVETRTLELKLRGTKILFFQEGTAWPRAAPSLSIQVNTEMHTFTSEEGQGKAQANEAIKIRRKLKPIHHTFEQNN